MLGLAEMFLLVELITFTVWCIDRLYIKWLDLALYYWRWRPWKYQPVDRNCSIL